MRGIPGTVTHYVVTPEGNPIDPVDLLDEADRLDAELAEQSADEVAE